MFKNKWLNSYYNALKGVNNMKIFKQIKITTPYLILITITIILIYFDMSFTKIENPLFEDILSEILMCIQPVIWIYFEKAGFKNMNNYYLMISGFILFYLGNLQDVMDEFYILEGPLSKIENILVPTGLITISIAVIWRFIEENKINNTLSKTNKIIYDKSIRDTLTGLYNRYHLEEHLDNILNELSKIHSEISVAFIDIDNFKTINDTYGHRTGDMTLKNLGEQINNCIRKSDYAFRYGGDEFLIIYPNTKAKTALQITERIKQKFSMSSAKENGIKLSLSIGIGAYKKFENHKNLIDRVDKIMYESKKNGKNQITVMDRIQ